MSLQNEIVERSSKIFRDAYQMSIGELINIYRDGEMEKWTYIQNFKGYLDGVNLRKQD